MQGEEWWGGDCCITGLFQVQEPGEPRVQSPWLRKWQEEERKRVRTQREKHKGTFNSLRSVRHCSLLNGSELISFPLILHLPIQHQCVKLQDATCGFMVLCSWETTKVNKSQAMLFSQAIKCVKFSSVEFSICWAILWMFVCAFVQSPYRSWLGLCFDRHKWFGLV